jgi:hypothetical protein
MGLTKKAIMPLIIWRDFDMDWNTLDSNDTFRLVFTDEQQKIDYDYCTSIKDLISWRNAQQLPPTELYVIKIGYSTFLKEDFIHTLTKFFSSNVEIFYNKPVRFSIYQDITEIKDFTTLHEYQQMAQKLLVLNIHCTIGWIIDFSKLNLKEFNNNADIYNFFNFLNEQSFNINPNVNNVIVFHNTHLIEDYSILHHLYNALNNTEKINGYDLTSHLNNLECFDINNINQNNNSLLDISSYMAQNNNQFLTQVLPEISNLYEKQLNNSQTLKEQISEFCQNGYIINIHNNTLSPLIYGSADDFTRPTTLPVKKLLLMVYEEVNYYFYNTITKIFLKSYCSQCDFLPQCQQQKIYWLNLLNTKQCGIHIDTYHNQS